MRMAFFDSSLETGDDSHMIMMTASRKEEWGAPTRMGASRREAWTPFTLTRKPGKKQPLFNVSSRPRVTKLTQFYFFIRFSLFTIKDRCKRVFFYFANTKSRFASIFWSVKGENQQRYSDVRGFLDFKVVIKERLSDLPQKIRDFQIRRTLSSAFDASRSGLAPRIRPPPLKGQVCSLTQFYFVDSSQSRISVCVFNKSTTKVCVSC